MEVAVWPDRRFLELVGSELPIVQAPMAGAQAGAMAAAVSKAGGLGSLPCAMLNVEQARGELQLIRQQTDRPINVNFFCHTPPAPDPAREQRWRGRLAGYYAELGVDPSAAAGASRTPFDAAMCALMLEMPPRVVSFHFGLPDQQLLARLKAAGIVVLGSATTVAEARWLEARGVDVIIAQGVEAGGHRCIFLTDDLTTQMGTFALLPQIVRAVNVPVLAAGGIADAKGVAAAIALGAAGVQVGTAYLLCPESTISAVHRAALKSAAAEHTALTNVFTGRPARGIVNRIMRDLGVMNAAAPAFPLATAAIAPLRAKAEAAGSGDFSPLWSGQNATGCREVGAAQLTRDLAAAIEPR